DYLQQSGKYTNSDLSDLSISDEYQSDHNGITHLYLQQRYQGLDIIHSMTNFNIKSGELESAAGSFISNVEQNINTNQPDITATQALLKVMHAHEITGQLPVIIEASANADRKTVFDKGIIAHDNINTRLVYLNFEESLKLCWEVSLYEKTCQNSWITYVDTKSTEILAENNQVIHCSFHKDKNDSAKSRVKHLAEIKLKQNAMVVANSYRVYAVPVESPIHGNRTLEIDPYPSGNAGTLGWHDDGNSTYTTSKGNNVDAYEDQNNSGNPTGGDAARAQGGANLEFDFTIDLTQDPNLNPPPYITNLFFWNNLMHDIWYEYGFTEIAGNFQQDNIGRGGLGSDYVNAEAQDGGGSNNANFNTPVDGSNPRMQMYLWNGSPEYDGDLDNGIIAHEYGHGISNRLTGGPSTTSCLGNAEQMGEGWSDFFGIWMTIEQGDNHADPRGIGTYVLGQDPSGLGIRPAQYTTDMAVNDYTYGDVADAGISQPHGIGFIWCTILWDLNWALVNAAGLDMDLYSGTGGNNHNARIIMDGLKFQPCSPGFVDGRNAIFQANLANNGGQYISILWNIFARRGLGYSADQGLSTDRFDQTEAFDLPPGVQFMTEEQLFGVDPLPVEMTAFNAIADNKKQLIELFWATATETNNKGFDLQRRTESESDFTSISWVDGSLNSNNFSTYTHQDRNVQSDLEYYYRIRQVDVDGVENYSDVVNAKLSGSISGIQIYPNPSPGISTVQLSNDITGRVDMQILNAQGQIIGSSIFETNGNAELEVDLSQQPEGVYFLKFDIGGEQFVKRVVLKK
ncbi:MAG: extracellular elastinolytic metalloproteinase, partial [Saprospiraceae bacterium]